jgi:hypothetical protein
VVRKPKIQKVKEKKKKIIQAYCDGYISPRLRE